MRVLLASVGSLGDIHPYVAWGRALQARGHEVTLLTNAEYEPVVSAAGLPFASAGADVNLAAAAANPNLWHAIKGMGVLWKHVLVPAIEPTFDCIAQLAARGRCTVVATPFMFGARLARAKLDHVTLLSAYSAPSLMRSEIAPMSIADHRIPRGVPRSAMRAVWRLLDRIKLEPMARPTLDRVAAQHGIATPLPAPLLGAWMQSPDGGITLFPEWFSAPKADWPQPLGIGGFPLYDDDAHAAGLSPRLQAFLDAGEAPIVFMPGSLMQHAQPFFASALQALRALGRRGVLLTPHTGQLPAQLPPDVLHEPYAPFGRLLPRAAALVHHGGIGSCAQGLRAGLPQVAMPMAHDQFDNACQLERLQVGRLIRPRSFDADRLAAALRSLQSDPRVAPACARWRERLAEPALDRLCELTEQLGLPERAC